MMEARMKMLRYILIVCSGVFIIQTAAIRCYTDLEATQSASVECGLATGCVKILKKSLDFDLYGKYIPEHKRGPNRDLFRGCFLISTPDVCHDARNGLTYCWCSSNDLCNKG